MDTYCTPTFRHRWMRCWLVFSVSCLLAPQPATAQRTDIAGWVYDRFTGDLLDSVEVYVAGSLAHTETNQEGFFHLRSIPPGGRWLVITRPHFESEIYSLEELATHPDTLDITLRRSRASPDSAPDPITLSKKWQRNVDIFEQHFIGTSENASECVFQNPEVLRFSQDGQALLATATAPLRFTNQALGYQVMYTLQAFRLEKKILQYRGLTHFEPLTPVDEEERVAWVQQRKVTYRGSLRHFFASLVAGHPRDAGFKVRSGRKTEYTQEVRSYPIVWSEVLSAAEAPYEKELSFEGDWQVIYVGTEKEDQYKTSWIWLEESIRMDQMGNVDVPDRVIRFGDWGTARICDLLLLEYLPD